ncbi:UDP-N-acetylmuramate dehydrogenase [Chloroflexota bacterium]
MNEDQSSYIEGTAADNRLRDMFGDRLQSGVSLRRYTAAKVGGLAHKFIEARSSQELLEIVTTLWGKEIPFLILGSGSNVLISDSGVREVVILNRSREHRFDRQMESPTVWAESGTNLSLLARLAAQKGLAGLEWAAGIPGTLGGAVVGNAGAHGKDIAGSLLMAEILHREVRQKGHIILQKQWPVEQLEYSYRTSSIKGNRGDAIVLSALLQLAHGSTQEIQKNIDEFTAFRKRTQPPGASMGSMFKNPPDDYAGRLIEAAGLKGFYIGDAEISSLHANFFINRGNASAEDIRTLINLARKKVAEEFDIQLELEIVLLGDWKD